MKLTTICFLCAAVAIIPVHCETKTINGDKKAKLPEFLSELDFASLEASEEDVEELKNVVKRLAPEKNGEYQVYQVFFGNEDLLKEWLKGADVSGQPGVDFPALTNIPATSFSCRGLRGGYYADLESNCQVFHICDNGRKISFLCPNGTIFQQSQLICDWWFKVDCSKSVELYEQSAEQFAEEERKREEFKKMNSEFRRGPENSDNANYFENSDYNGRQNGRSNPYGQSAVQNEIQDQQNLKSQNRVYDQQGNRASNQYNNQNNLNSFSKSSNDKKYDQNQQRDSTTANYPTTFRQQNQLVNDQREKGNQLNNNLDRGSNKFSDKNSNHLNQGKSSQDVDYYGSTPSANAQKDERQNFRNSKSQSYTRNNFNNPTQKVTPSYTETTTFRTSTANPIREFQELAESASFGQGMRYNKAYSSSNFNTYYNNRKSSTSTPPKERERFVQATTRNGIPAFPGSTFAPIFKPRVASTTPRAVNTQKSYTNTNYYGQNLEERRTSLESATRASYTNNYQTTNQKNIGSTNYYSSQYKPTNSPTQYSNYRTTTPSASESYDTQNNYNAGFTTSSTRNQDGANRYNQKYTGTPDSPFTENAAQVSRNKNKQASRDQQHFAKNTASASNTRQNFINASTEKPTRSTQADLSKTSVPYDRNVNYQQPKATSTVGPYVPFTKNYAFSSTSTIKSPVYTATVPTYRDNSNTPTPKNKPTTNRATYLPKKTTVPVGSASTTQKPPLANRPLNEREHALSMLQSLQGLEGTVPTLVNARGGNRPGLNIPTSSGPSALHSLALYFATAANNSGDSAGSEVQNDSETTAQKTTNSSTELPTSLLTRHTINSYVELFNLNNALEYNGTNFGGSEEDINENEDFSDLELQQSAGPLNGGRKSNGTKLRELAQVFTQALSAYLQDPETFKRVLTDIRPTEPPGSDEQFESTTASLTTTEEYPSVTKEKDEVLDFSDDVTGARRRHPLTTIYPDTTRQPFYDSQTDYYSTTLTSAETQYPTSTQNARDGPNDFAYNVNNAFESTNADYKSGPTATNNVGNDYESYFPSGSNQVSGSRNNTEPYGKYVKPFDATPISDNYVTSSTPASYGDVETIAPNNNKAQVEELRQDLTPPVFQNLAYSTGTTNEGNSGTTFYTRDQESTTSEPFRIRYYDTTQTNVVGNQVNSKDESLIPANSLYPNYENNYNAFQTTDKSLTNNNVPIGDSQQNNDHWTSSPSITQLWESTVFVDPQRINQGLVPDFTNGPSTIEPRFSNGIEYSTSFSRDEALATDTFNSVTPRNYVGDSSTWQWTPSTDDSPTAFTLLPNAYSSEATTTPTPVYSMRSSVSTTVTSSSSKDERTAMPQKYSLLNVTENEITKAHEMFGNLNETSSSKLMKVMQQAENNVTVRQLVLLLISHCDGPMNKTMEEEKEELLSALLRLPVHEFSSAESTEIIRGISRIRLPLGRSRSSTKTQSPSTAAPTEPSVTTYRSRKGRRYKSTTELSTSRRRTDEVAPAESRNSVIVEGDSVSDSRALELLRSLYSIAAKWG